MRRSTVMHNKRCWQLPTARFRSEHHLWRCWYFQCFIMNTHVYYTYRHSSGLCCSVVSYYFSVLSWTQMCTTSLLWIKKKHYSMSSCAPNCVPSKNGLLSAYSYRKLHSTGSSSKRRWKPTNRFLTRKPLLLHNALNYGVSFLFSIIQKNVVWSFSQYVGRSPRDLRCSQPQLLLVLEV